ncbi:MAG: ankyrin repeat domain-containing protein [Gammaproteobacteria bacterium]
MSFPRGMIATSMQTLGYISDIEGVCYGLSHMAVQALLANDIDTFIKRLRIIKKNHSILRTKEDWENHFRELDIKAANKTITSEELIDLEIRPFFDGIELYHLAHKHPEFFEKEKRPHMQDAVLTAPLIYPINLEKQEEKREAFAEILSFSGAYRHADLIKYFTSLRDIIEGAKLDQPVPITLMSAEHAITIGYIPEKNQWYFIDPGDLYLEPTNDINISSIANAVINAFSQNDCAVFATKFYAAKKNKDQMKKVTMDWTSCEAWQNIHEPTKEEAQNNVDSKKWSWLHLASRYGHVDEMDKLIKAGVDINQTSIRGETPLYLAVEARRLDATKTLIKASADVNKSNTDKDQNTSLFIAAQKGFPELVDVLLLNGAVVDKSNNHDVTPLLVAASQGHLDVVMKFIKAKANVNHLATAKGNLTALYSAAQGNHLAVAKELITAGADINTLNTGGMSALSIAAAKGHSMMVTYLMETGASLNHKGRTPLFMAALNGHVALVETLLAAGADVNSVDSQGMTPMFGAVERGHSDVVIKLLTANANINHTNNSGGTALHIAAHNGHPAIVEKLIEAGANIHLEMHNGGVTPLIAAINAGHLNVVEKLITANVNVNQVTSKKTTALLCAVQNGNCIMVEKLVAAGADINYSKDGDSLLHTAVSRGRVDMVEKLIKCKANINEGNDEGMTPLHIALNSKHLDVVDLLLKNGGGFYEDYCNDDTFPSIARFIKDCLLEKCTDPNLNYKFRAKKLTIVDLAREMKYEAIANFLVNYQVKKTNSITAISFFKEGGEVKPDNQSSVSDEAQTTKKILGM